jgi:hypothetical protein
MEKVQGYRTVTIPNTGPMAHYANVPFYYSFARDLEHYEQIEKLVNNDSNINHETLAKYEGKAIFYKTKGGEEKSGSVIALKPGKPYISIIEKDAIMMKVEFQSLEWIALAKYVVKRKERAASSEPIVPLTLEPLHEDIAVNIIRQLPDEDLCLYATVNKTWYKLCNSPIVWETCFRTKFNVPADYTPYAQGGWKEEYKEWCDVEKFADSVYIFNTASDPGQVHTTRYLLHHKMTSINSAAWRYNTTLLGCAIESGDLNMVKHLIHYGADVNQHHTRESWTPLFTAIKKRKFDIAKYLVDEHKCTIEENELEEAMMFVAGSDAVDMFKFLLEKAGAGAKIASDPQEFGSLLSISLQSISVDVLEELLKVPGVSPKGQDQLAVNMVLQVWIQSFGWLSLPAITSDILRITKALVSFGFPKNLPGGSGKTPLQLLEEKISLMNGNAGDTLLPEHKEQFLLAKEDPQLEELRSLLVD